MADPAQRPAGLESHYEFRRELGRGASGTVYLGLDRYRQREVAIKIAHAHIFRDDAANNIARKAWLNEVHLAGNLHHPYIVEVFDAGFNEDCAWLVMEYLPQGTLEPFTRPDTLKPVSEVLELIYKCASALDYACRNGIIHRDIKPANLQYLGNGEIKVGDFGAAYWAHNEEATQVMDIGSIAYMAPELFRQWITPRADIYALGVVLYQLLCGRFPFEADNQGALVYAITHGIRTPLAIRRPDLPQTLTDFVERMMAADIEARFASWTEVLRALSALLPLFRTQSRPASADEAPLATPPQDGFAEMFARLRQTRLLAELNDAELWEILRISRWYQVEKGTLLVVEGAPARSCYMLLEGSASVQQQGKIIGYIPAGTFFGELAIAETPPSPRAATVIASTAAIVGKWPFEALLATAPSTQNKLLRIFFRLTAERLKKVDEQYLLLCRQYLKAAQEDDSAV